MNNKLGIEFEKGAEASFFSLPDREKNKAMDILNRISEDMNSDYLRNKFYKLVGTKEHLFAVRLNPKLRIIIEIKDDRIIVLDILNHDLFLRYFNNRVKK